MPRAGSGQSSGSLPPVCSPSTSLSLSPCPVSSTVTTCGEDPGMGQVSLLPAQVCWVLSQLFCSPLAPPCAPLALLAFTSCSTLLC